MSTKEEILNYIASSDNKNESNELEDNNEKNLIKNILNLGNKSVEDIMVPRAEIVSIEKNQSIEEIYFLVESDSHSRMPVYQSNLDNVIGFLHVKDLLTLSPKKNFDLQDIIRNILYVAPKSPILDLLKRMRSSRIHMGLVVDEFGGVDGLITIEDLVEEIVGEIEDEHDFDEGAAMVLRQSADHLVVKATLPVSRFNQLVKTALDETEFDTLGGAVTDQLGHVPQRGETVEFEGHEVEVLSADARQARLLRVARLPAG